MPEETEQIDVDEKRAIPERVQKFFIALKTFSNVVPSKIRAGATCKRLNKLLPVQDRPAQISDLNRWTPSHFLRTREQIRICLKELKEGIGESNEVSHARRSDIQLNQELAELLKNARNVLGDTQKHAAISMGVDPSTVATFESGEGNITLGTLNLAIGYVNRALKRAVGRVAQTSEPGPSGR